MKKTVISVILLVLLIVPAFCQTALAANDPFTARVTDVDGVGDDDNGDGMVLFFQGNRTGERIVSSEEHNLRYTFLLVFDRNGKCVQVGNNLLFASRDNTWQNYIVIPERGFLIAFYYNESSFTTNVQIYNYYVSLCNVLTGKPEDDIYNYTLEIESDYTCKHDNGKLSFTYGTYGTVKGDCRDTDPDDRFESSTEQETPPEKIPKNGAYAKITGTDEKSSNIDGETVVLYNRSDSELKFISDEYDFLYKYVFVFDKNGGCTALGYNILMSSSNPDNNFITVPAGGFAVSFFYNSDSAKKNAEIYKIYSKAADANAVNTVLAPTRPVKGYIEDKYFIVYLDGDAPAVSPDESSETVSNDVSEISDTESSDSSEPTESSAVEVSEFSAVVDESENNTESSEVVAESSDASNDESSDGGADIGLIIGIVAVLIVIAGVAVFFFVKKKKA